jgi:probable HAF family extracellular repeat protein
VSFRSGRSALAQKTPIAGPNRPPASEASKSSGRAQQYVDLHFLPSTFASPNANGVDASGNIVGYATDTSGVNHAILWQPVH